jgi:hypothetical protein
MTERDAAADLTVCEAAAQEPWGVDHVDGSDWIANELHGVITPGIGNDGQPYLVANDTDLEFIALAREALPYWIHRAEEQRQRAERAERALELAASNIFGATEEGVLCPLDDGRTCLCGPSIADDGECARRIKDWYLAQAQKGVKRDE